MKKVHLFLVFIFTFSSVFSQQLIDFVDPFIGTQNMGHTFPGATVPFGSIQLSPDTDTLPYSVNNQYNKEVYRYCAGYQYTDPTIVGFSHTHFSGTGHSDLGDILIMPTTGTLKLNPGTSSVPESGFRSRYSHTNEQATPDYYRVYLQDYGIDAELTSTTRVGMHQYTFPASSQSHIILDMVHGIYNYPGKNVRTFIRVVNDTLLTGYRETRGWARTRTVFFAVTFSKPFKSYGAKDFSGNQPYRGFWGKWNENENFSELSNAQIRMHFDFETKSSEKILLKVSLSPVSMNNALENLRLEIPDWNFDRVKMEGQEKWNHELSKVKAELMNRADSINFYTSMYHAFLGPTVYEDLNGQYKGLDQQVHTAKGFTNYTTFSLWDTHRALHPLFNLIQPERNRDMVTSMLNHFYQNATGMLPVWSTYGNETWCMSGYHSVSVIADAVAKGVYKDNLRALLDACIATSSKIRYEGIGDYIRYGFVPYEVNGNSVSNTLEYAYDDWTISRLAMAVGDTGVYHKYLERSQNWKNVFDKQSGFMRPRSVNGSFKTDFNALSTHGQGFIEGNAWNYTLYVPHDPATLISEMGGSKKFISYLDSLFTMHLPDEFFAETEDITREGIIGNYVHGNEPSHHVVYLYNWTNQPWKTQERVRMIMRMQYHNGADGLGGNDDCGQMSAWYLFSALGFYPVAPGSTQYALGSPLVKSAVIALENGKELKIKTINQSDGNVYVKKVELNGKKLQRPFFDHNDIREGGELVFYLSNKK